MFENHKPEKVKGEIQKLFNIGWKDDATKTTLELISCAELNDASWGAWFGEIQDILKFGHYEGYKFTQCNVDLRYCLWGDPLPLLSLALTLNEYELTGGNVSITLPIIPSNNQILNANIFLSVFKCKKHYSNDKLIEIMKALLYEEQIEDFKSPNINAYTDKEITFLEEELKKQSEEIVNKARFLKYLYREGFLTLFSKGKIINLSSEAELSTSRICKTGDSVLTSLPASLNELPVSLAFERSTCVAGTILKLDVKNIQGTFKKIDKWVEQQLHQNISQVVYEEVPSWAQGDLQYRLIILLRETLHNIAEHAYRDKKNGFAAVYVRYREGALGEDSTTWGRLEQFAKREANQQKTPLLQTKKLDSFSNTRSGFFEVFVLDSGQGLINSLNKASTEDKQNNLHQAMLDIFIRNNTSKGENRPTEHGGLYLLRKLLSPHQDYFRVRDEDTWWGTPVHLFNGNTISNHITVQAYGKKFGNKEITGLAWTVRLSWLEAQDHSGQEQLWRGVENKSIDEQAQIRKLFKDINNKSLSPKGVVIRDSRFFSFQSDIYSNDEYDVDTSEFLFLPRPLLMKNVIQDEINRFLNKFKKCKVANLVIGDVPSEEAITYLAAIVRANKFIHSPFTQIERIIIITRELRVCVLTRTPKDNLFEINKSEGNSFFVENKSDTLVYSNIINYLREIRRHDSHRISEIVTKSSSSANADFIKEEVEWSDGLILDGYLDFPQSLTHPLCREIYLLSLKRLTGASINGCRLESLDSLVDSLVTRFNAQIHPRPSKKESDNSETVIQIGSIKVTGYTEESEHQENKRVFHFFQHPTGNAKGAFLLPWISSLDDIIKIEDISRPYIRVGKTPVIARGGWKSYEIPRFDQGDRCIYEKTPRDSYRAWQDPSRSPMKLGHWVYGGHHEIFTVNLLLAFNSELEHIGSGNSLAKYIYANFFRVFGIKEKDLNSPNKSLIKSVQEAQFKHLLPKILGEQKPLLVYPSHPVTDHIVNEFLCLLEDEALSKIRNNLIAILPVRRHRSGSGLQVSGITLERLNKAIDPENERPVVYFDDGVISGRTFIEIKTLLRGMGYGDIYSVVLLDRQRLPSVHHLKNDKHVGYWRLDAPSMGSKAHCPLCHAIDKIIAIEDTIVSEVHKRRIKEWCDTWKELDPSTQWGSQGLRPIPLNLKKPNRRFCLRYNSETKEYQGIGEEKDQEILLTNSAGLIAWVTEIHTITSRDDFSIRLIEKESENLSGEVRIQLLASQLLLFSAEFNTKQAEVLALALIEELWNLSGHDRHSALASLVLVSCVKDPFVLTKKFLNSLNRWSELKAKNIDFILFVCCNSIDLM